MNFRGGAIAGRRKREEARIEITPLIDIVFLLLIFFLLTTTFVKEKKPNIPIDVPQAVSAHATPKKEDVTVHITREGQIFVEDVAQEGDEALRKTLEAAHTKSPEITVLLRADTESQHGVVVKVMDMAKQLGIRRFGIVSKRP